MALARVCPPLTSALPAYASVFARVHAGAQVDALQVLSVLVQESCEAARLVSGAGGMPHLLRLVLHKRSEARGDPAPPPHTHVARTRTP